MGQERTLAAIDFMSALPPITDINSAITDIGDSMSALPPKADIRPHNTNRPPCYFSIRVVVVLDSRKCYDLWPVGVGIGEILA